MGQENKLQKIYSMKIPFMLKNFFIIICDHVLERGEEREEMWMGYLLYVP